MIIKRKITTIYTFDTDSVRKKFSWRYPNLANALPETDNKQAWLNWMDKYFEDFEDFESFSKFIDYYEEEV